MSTATERLTPTGESRLTRPLLAPWWRCVEDEQRLLFEHAGQVVELNGRAVRTLLPALIPLLDGTHTVSEIVDTLGEGAEQPILKTLALLDDNGLLVDGPPASKSDDAAATYVAAVCGATPAAAAASLTQARVALVGSAPVGTEVGRLLASAGVATSSCAPTDRSPAHVDLMVAVPGADEVDELRSFNDRRLSDATPWLVVLPTDGRFAAVGPLYVPGQTACHACYLVRRGATSGYELDFPLFEARPPQAPMPAAASTAVAGLASLICLRWLGAADPTLPGVLYALELHGTIGLQRHRVLRVPRCPACGSQSPPLSPWFRELGAGAA